MKKSIIYNNSSNEFVFSVTIDGEFMGGGSAKMRDIAEVKVQELADKILDRVESEELVEYHRGPTSYEIKFGEGAIHYRSFPMKECVKPDGRLKKWFKADDGLRYYR